MTTSPKPLKGPEMVGRAWRCLDGVVRWVIDRTASTGNLHVLWLGEDTGVWYPGGCYHPKDLLALIGPLNLAHEYKPPQPGEEYTYCGTGNRVTRWVPARSIAPWNLGPSA